MRLVIAAVATTVAATIAIAAPMVAQQPQLPGSKSTAAISGGTYTVDPGHTLVRWEVDHFGFTPYWWLFGSITGTATFDKANPAASKVDITIPVAKVTTASAGLTGHLLKDVEAVTSYHLGDDAQGSGTSGRNRPVTIPATAAALEATLSDLVER